MLYHFQTMVETIVCCYLQGNQHIPVFLRWCEVDLVHPQYRPFEGLRVFPCGLWLRSGLLMFSLHLKVGMGRNYTTRKPQVVVHDSIYQGSILGTYF